MPSTNSFSLKLASRPTASGAHLLRSSAFKRFSWSRIFFQILASISFALIVLIDNSIHQEVIASLVINRMIKLTITMILPCNSAGISTPTDSLANIATNMIALIHKVLLKYHFLTIIYLPFNMSTHFCTGLIIHTPSTGS